MLSREKLIPLLDIYSKTVILNNLFVTKDSVFTVSDSMVNPLQYPHIGIPKRNMK